MSWSHLRVLFIVLAAGASAYVIYFAFMPTSSSQQPIIVEIHKGEGPLEMTKALVSKNAMSHPRLFLWLGRITRQWGRVKAGEYQITPSLSPLEIFEVLTSGISIQHPVTVREGENIYEIASDLQSKGLADRASFLSLCQNHEFIMTLPSLSQDPPPSLEGYLFPDTYFLNKTLSTEDIIRKMVKQFSLAWGPQEEAQASHLRMTRHQIITLASIIEKETGAPHERALISSVFHNRLKKRMRLQSDPTTIYGIWGRFNGKLRKGDLTSSTPYNTYVISGLPPGPISNPGKDAIQAALSPLPTPYLYFVSHNDGTHEFSHDYSAHQRAIRKFQLDPRARIGKSWRDLKKQYHPPESQPGLQQDGQ